MENLLQTLHLDSIYLFAAAAAVLLAALLLCFAGKRFLRLLTAFFGFCAGSMVSLFLFNTFLPDFNQGMLIGAALVIGALCAAIAFYLVKITLFVMILSLIAFIGTRFIPSALSFLSLSLSNEIILGISLGIGLVAAILALIFTRPIVILATSLAGSYLFIEVLLNQLLLRDYVLPVYLFWIFIGLMFLLGCLIQFFVTARLPKNTDAGKHSRRKDRDDDDDDSDEEYDEDSDEEYDEDSDEGYDDDSDEEYDEDSDEEYDEDSDEEYDEDSDEEYDEDSDEEYDEDSDEDFRK